MDANRKKERELEVQICNLKLELGRLKRVLRLANDFVETGEDLYLYRLKQEIKRLKIIEGAWKA